MFGAGRSFLLVGGEIGKPHLWFVLTDPDPVTKQVVRVMMVSAQPHTDNTVVIVVGDHPWVEWESNVDYGTARFVPVSKLEAAVAQGRLRLKEDMSAELLGRVRAGLLVSSRTIHAIKDQCRSLFGDP